MKQEPGSTVSLPRIRESYTCVARAALGADLDQSRLGVSSEICGRCLNQPVALRRLPMNLGRLFSGRAPSAHRGIPHERSHRLCSMFRTPWGSSYVSTPTSGPEAQRYRTFFGAIWSTRESIYQISMITQDTSTYTATSRKQAAPAAGSGGVRRPESWSWAGSESFCWI